MARRPKPYSPSQEEVQLASFWNYKFKNAMVHKADYTRRWTDYWDAYNGDYFKNKKLPEYRSNLVSNYIFSIVETVRPIMLDNDPKFQAMPRHPEGMDLANDLQEALSFEWDREKVTTKLTRDLITTLVVGTSVYFVPWDKDKKEIRAHSVNPFNIFPDPLATSVEDAEYIIYASYYNDVRLQRMFPEKASLLEGGDVNYGELVHDNDKNANIDNQILVLEVWTRDYETLEADKDGKTRQKYPNGRVITLCPELGIVLSDKANPYQDGKFPFVLMKDYDVPGKFWGEGEVAQLLSPQQYMNELNNAILDSAKLTANMPWVIDKNSGIPYNSITTQPGLILRKNPGTEVRREQPPNMPTYVINALETYKVDMEQISGVFDSLKGNSETGVYTAQGVLALQEAGQARVRLKVKLMESALGEMATMWVNRMRQFWTDNRYIRVTKPDGTYDVKEFNNDAFKYEYDVRITSGSTMPVNRGAMLDLMVRLAQTPTSDGQALVDREAVVHYLPEEVKSTILRRMEGKALAVEQQIEELSANQQALTQALEQLAQESQNGEGEVFNVIEQVSSAIEKINQQILQLQAEHDRILEEKQKQEETEKIREQAYNEGYADAEGLLGGEGDVLDDALPDDILAGLETLNDEELAVLLQSNPSLADLISFNNDDENLE